MSAPIEVTDMVTRDGALYRRMNNEAANTELARRGVSGGRVSGELPPDEIVWVTMTMGDAVWLAVAGGTLAPAPPV